MSYQKLPPLRLWPQIWTLYLKLHHRCHRLPLPAAHLQQATPTMKTTIGSRLLAHLVTRPPAGSYHRHLQWRHLVCHHRETKHNWNIPKKHNEMYTYLLTQWGGIIYDRIISFFIIDYSTPLWLPNHSYWKKPEMIGLHHLFDDTCLCQPISNDKKQKIIPPPPAFFWTWIHNTYLPPCPP